MPRYRPVRIAPSVLSADFGCLAQQIREVEAGGADLLHIDVMDGHFVPNISLGVPVVRSIAQHTRLPLDTHLMIADPVRYAPAFVEAGATSITFHVEAIADPAAAVRAIRALGVPVGVSLNPGTPADRVSPILHDVDLVLVMTVWPGFGGQSFIAAELDKIAWLSERLGQDQALEVDGGINIDTAAQVATAGADTLVAGSAVFGAADPAEAVRSLRAAATAAQAVERSR